MAGVARERLTRARILRAALDLVDGEGLAALTMRRLGRELGVEAMSLYHHVPSKDALLGDLVEALLAGVEVPDAEVGDWTERVRTMARSYRRLAHAHPHAFPLIVSGAPRTPDGLKSVDAMIDVLRAAGWGDQTARDAFHAVAGYATGFALFEIGGLVATGVDPVIRGGTEGDVKPLFAQGDAQFEFGLDAIVRGLTAKLGSPVGAAREESQG